MTGICELSQVPHGKATVMHQKRYSSLEAQRQLFTPYSLSYWEYTSLRLSIWAPPCGYKYLSRGPALQLFLSQPIDRHSCLYGRNLGCGFPLLRTCCLSKGSTKENSLTHKSSLTLDCVLTLLTDLCLDCLLGCWPQTGLWYCWTLILPLLKPDSNFPICHLWKNMRPNPNSVDLKLNFSLVNQIYFQRRLK